MTAGLPKITIALLDDHPVIMAAVKPILSRGQMEVIGAFADVAALRRGLEHYRHATGDDVQVALIDYHLGENEPDGIALIRALTERYPKTRFIVFSAVTEDVFKTLAIANGARGFIGKTVPLERLAQHVLTVARNATVIDPPLQGNMMKPSGAVDTHGLERLTAKEMDIARLLLGTMKNSEIAAKLRKRPSTISTQARAIYSKIGVADRLQFSGAREEWLRRIDSLGERIHARRKARRPPKRPKDSN